MFGGLSQEKCQRRHPRQKGWWPLDILLICRNQRRASAEAFLRAFVHAPLPLSKKWKGCAQMPAPQPKKTIGAGLFISLNQ
jgi:hypothetical protein